MKMSKRYVESAKLVDSNKEYQIKEALENMGISDFEVAEIEMLAQSEVTLTRDDLRLFERLIDTLEDDDDVQKVYHNVELED